MKAMVTGATGFIGANLVRELLKHGYQVKALVREGSNRKNIESLDIEVVTGDLRDVASLNSSLGGCEALFHVAASYTLWASDCREIYETNVRGTENILNAALKNNVQKVVYTSTESTIGIARKGQPGTEEMEVNPADLAGDYKKSKYIAEKVALGMCRGGLPVVIVNPTMPVGPFDIKPTPTGKLIVDFLNGKMPAYVNTGLNVIDVEDVARGHILALEKGRIGERYILGNENLTLREILAILGRISGLDAPRLRIPISLALVLAYADQLVEGMILRRPPRIPLAGVRTSRKFRHFDCSKAIQELGLPQSSVEEAFDKAVSWFRQNRYAS